MSTSHSERRLMPESPLDSFYQQANVPGMWRWVKILVFTSNSKVKVMEGNSIVVTEV